MPPLLEYMDSLLTGTGHDLELRTFKVVDQLSGRMMGVRADITPQVARIDAHLLNRKGVTRLCYCGSVLHTRPARARARRASRSRSAPRSTATRASRPTWRSCGCCARRSSRGRAQRARRHRPRRGVPLAHAPASSTASSRRQLFEALQRKDVPSLESADQGTRTRKPAKRCFCCPSSTAASRCSTTRGEEAAEARRADARARHAAAARQGLQPARRASISPSCAATTTIPAWCSTPTATA